MRRATPERHARHPWRRQQAIGDTGRLARPTPVPRQPPADDPTPAALLLASGIETGLRHITDALDDMEQTGHVDHKIQVLAPATFAIHWLIPKLPMLRASGLKMKAHVRYTHTNEHWQELPYDLAIRADGVVPAGHVERPLFRGRLGLIAALDIADAVRTIGDLKAVKLLESETRPMKLVR